MECYDRPTPVKYNQYTKFHISDAGIDCINIDKSYITASMTYHMKLSLVSPSQISNNTPDANREVFYKMFIGLKNASHNIDTYRIYINHNQIYSQTDSIYEQALVTAMKPKPEMFRPHMYTMWDEAHKHSKNVCGVYVPIRENLGQEFDITFDIAIQLDDLLPFSGMSIFPSCVIGDLELEIRNRIQGNLVYCQVDPNVLVDEAIAAHVSGDDFPCTVNGLLLANFWDAASSVKQALYDAEYTKEFTQVGDVARVCSHVYSGVKDGSIDHTQNYSVCLECTNSIMNNAMSHINGFRLKDICSINCIILFSYNCFKK